MSDPKVCARCLGTERVGDDDRCERCEGTGIEPEADPEPELMTRDEFLLVLRDVLNRRTGILCNLTDFFKDELGEE